MRKFGAALSGIDQQHRQESHTGRISTVGDGGRSIAMANMSNSQLRDLIPISPYGVASSPPVGLKAFAIVSDNNENDGMIGVYDPNRPKCKPGNSVLYSSGGAKVECIGDKVYVNGVDILSEIEALKNK